MAYNFSGSGQNLFSTSTPVTATPLTLACWMNKTAATTTGILTAIFWDGAGSWYAFYLAAGSAANGQKVGINLANNNSFGAGANATTTYTTGTWHHACGVFTSSTSRTVYMDGGNSATDTSSVTPTNLNSVNIGAARRQTVTDNYFDGSIAEVGIWDAALTQAEVGALADGMSPQLVRPQNLKVYVPLVRSTQDLKGLSFTTVGSPTVSAQTRVYLR